VLRMKQTSYYSRTRQRDIEPTDPTKFVLSASYKRIENASVY
jgi:hypothetical protein